MTQDNKPPGAPLEFTIFGLAEDACGRSWKTIKFETRVGVRMDVCWVVGTTEIGLSISGRQTLAFADELEAAAHAIRAMASKEAVA